jgi:GxxExxY protein
MTENSIAHDVVDAAYRIHSKLGPGLLESVYRIVLASELTQRGYRVLSEHPVPIVYGGMQFEVGFRADLIVEDKVIIEVKSVSAIIAVHKKQLLTYLRLSNMKLGLLINFSEALIKDGVCRVVNGLKDSNADSI